VIVIDLPFPPSVNHYYRHVGPRILISREGREYRGCVCAIVARMGIRGVTAPLEIPLDVRIEVFPPDRRRRDLDNLQKSLLDSLQHAGIYRDDSQVSRLTVERLAVIRGGRITVTIREYIA
jgi:crossover junction endodeoxyribonuclease RusA